VTAFAAERLVVARSSERGQSCRALAHPGSAGRPPWAQAFGSPCNLRAALSAAAQAAYN